MISISNHILLGEFHIGFTVLGQIMLKGNNGRSRDTPERYARRRIVVLTQSSECDLELRKQHQILTPCHLSSLITVCTEERHYIIR
jgi:hypothetical protein